ncbi:hypothetical protein DRJ54_01825 [Candidatus Acetothermia bacterium]|nr:MAG: hypothetical protein DRJ54_01825 [Candidatus Acetothermia bacterium]
MIFIIKKQILTMCRLCLVLLIFLFIIPFSQGMLNPAQVYCEALGYQYTTHDDRGFCILPDNSEVDAWEFLQGKVATEYSYCETRGLAIKTVNDSEKCIRFLLDECAVCVLPNGEEVEVTELMNLSFDETVCGDGVCGLPENYNTCPQDCPSGSWDNYCDGASDGICDPDCKYQETPQKDPDCPFCGDNVCGEDENCESCPEDCGECVKKSVCGDAVCDADETQENCCTDCGCPVGMKCIQNKCVEEKCGNGVCEPNFQENYKTCPRDCPSGSPDNYCDKQIDGRCDPDCSEQEDLDCKTQEGLPIIVYVSIVVVLIAIVLFVVLKSRRSETYSYEEY